jgi:hypothetical protein
MPRPQFTLKSPLWLMVCVAALFGGYAIGVRHERAREQAFWDLDLELAMREAMAKAKRMDDDRKRAASLPASQAPQ